MKRLFFILRTRGANWDRDRTLEEQDGWSGHVEFMNRLAREGFIVLGGPLEGTPNVLLLAMAENEEAVRARLAGDIWAQQDLLRVERVAPWSLKLGIWQKA
ncbi:MAG: hypothetical protein JSR55_00290 [Proteobacteria bacterium]|nr:hypothetical protein [Pseudomonadota bacterium]